MQVLHSTQLKSAVGNFAHSRASIEMNGMAFKMLSSGLYSDKIAAPIREIGCNAADAHVMVGTPDRPFEVKLPTILSPDFSIRDFGPGLSHDQVMNNYQRYFHSDKRVDRLDADGNVVVSANDLVGCLGLGSKSPRAYTDQFTVKSVQNGVMRTYVCCDDEDGVPGVNLVLESEAPSDWQHGLEVSFSVKSSDHGEFERKAKEIFRWFRIPPINKSTGEPFEAATPDWSFGNLRHFGLGSTDFNAARNGAVQMGNVLYKLDFGQLLTIDGQEHIHNAVRGVFHHDLVITVPIGTVEVTASRETIEYTPRTIRNLRQALDDEMKSVAARITEYFAARPQLTMADYQNVLNEIIPAQFQAALEFFKKGIKQHLSTEDWDRFATACSRAVELVGWREVIEDCDAHAIPRPCGVYHWSSDNGRRKTSIFQGTIATDKNLRVVVNDKPVRWKERLREIFNEAPDRPVLVFSCPRDEDLPGVCDLLNENSIPINYEMLSGRPKPPPKPKGTGGKRAPQDRTVGAHSLSTKLICGGGAWAPPSVRVGDIADRYYVIRGASWGRRWMAMTLGQNDPYHLITCLQRLGAAGIQIPSHLAVVTESELQKKKLDELGFKHLDCWVQDVLLKDQRVIDLQQAQIEITGVNYAEWYMGSLVESLYNALYAGGWKRDAVQRVLAGTPLLQDLEDLRSRHHAARDRAQQATAAANALNSDPLHKALAQCGIQPSRHAGGVLLINEELKLISGRHPLLNWLNVRGLPNDKAETEFILLATVLAVTQPDPTLTAEET